MKTRNRKSVLALSLVTAMLLGSSAYAGKIITDADVNNIVVTPDKQFGFGGWNFDNVNVKITDLEYNDIGKEFNITDGTYDAMVSGDSFESEIMTEGEHRGNLHGKDWPVGEPAGIKIINDDTKVKHGKPVNCIMTSSYQEFRDDLNNTGYLDAFEEAAQPNPVICSSPWQTHKRYKINLLPTSVDNVAVGEEGYGKPIDIVFNLDPADTNTTVRRYQVLQKANNYSGKRLKGYKIEVFGENGLPNDALTLSLGLGEGDADGDIWGVDDMANMSHGLWGPYEEDRFDNGFFDYIRAYYPVTLADDNKTISYTGNMEGGNYQAIFGNWLPSIWEPMGIFHDDDQNPETDGILKAFFGTAPGYTEDAWYKSTVVYNPETPEVKPAYTWSLATADDFLEWSGDWYTVDAVEDVLNLGLNYIVNVGTNADIGATFTIRITPYVDSDQTQPSYVDKDPSLPPSDINTPPTANAGADQTVQVNNTVTITGSGTDSDGRITTYQWFYGTTIVANTASFEFTPTVVGTATLTLIVTDNDGATGTDTMTVTVTTVDDGVTPPDGGVTPPAPPYYDSGSGGGCTYNPNSNSFDMTFLFMMALGLLYPFRRRFLK